MSNQERLAALAPQQVWRWFAAISDIPRASGKEAQAIAFVRNFAARHALHAETDDVGNIVVRKSATPGMEDCSPVALQCHLDMVQQKDPGLPFDFDVDPIRIRVDGDWLCAAGTTLGADNGIGVALILAVLAAEDLPHPAIEALFTVDEELGMTGALAVTREQLSARMMINLDMGSDHELTIGCAGTVDVIATGRYEPSARGPNFALVEVSLSGGASGHSGEDINLGRANAIRVLCAILHELHGVAPFQLARIDAPGVPNVIPGGASALLATDASSASDLTRQFETIASDHLRPFLDVEPHMIASCTPVAAHMPTLMPDEMRSALFRAVSATPSGVLAMSDTVEGLVETSNNLASLVVAEGVLVAGNLVRSAIDASKRRVVDAIRTAWVGIGADITTANDTPGWQPDPQSGLLSIINDAYRAETGTEARVTAIHSGLECGIFAATFPDMELVSYGPNMRDIHTTRECLQISSTQKVWSVLKKALASMPHQGKSR